MDVRLILVLICVPFVSGKKASRILCSRDSDIFIRLTQICDNVDDCHDGTDDSPPVDERGCRFRCLRPGMTREGSRFRKIPFKWLCDRERDCPGGYDERCLRCKNGKRVHHKWRCDGDDDCGDCTDELNCRSGKGAESCESSESAESRRRQLELRRRRARSRRPSRRRRPEKSDSASFEVEITEDLKEIIVGYHNRQRTRVARGKIRGQPKAANMKLMYWDEDIAKAAEKWADKCDFRHEKKATDENHCGVSDFHYLGENLGVTTIDIPEEEVSPSEMKRIIKSQLSRMFTEHKYWSFGKVGQAECKLSPCGHYTQIVWADSEAIGCAIVHCNRVKNWKHGKTESLYLVCKYGPAGNIKASFPYNRGRPCSECYGAPCLDKALCDSRKADRVSCKDSRYSCARMRKSGVTGRFKCWSCAKIKKEGRCNLCTKGGRMFRWNSVNCRKTCGLCDSKYRLTNKPRIPSKPELRRLFA